MPAPFLMLGAALLFSLMGLCVKLASSQYSPSEILLVRSLVGVALLLGLARWRGVSALLLGSETQKVLTHSKIPVLVVR